MSYFGAVRVGNVLISNMDFWSFLIWKHIAFLLEKTSCFVIIGVRFFWPYIEIFFSCLETDSFCVVTRSSLSIKTICHCSEKNLFKAKITT